MHHKDAEMEGDIMNKKLLRSGISIMLAVTLSITGIFPLQLNLGYAKAAETVQDATVDVSSLVQVKVDSSEAKNMQLYLNGVYETAQQMEAGSHSVSLLVNGTEAASTTLSLESDKTVYLRYKDGQLSTSADTEEKGFYDSATLVGSFNDGLKLKKGDGEAFSLGDWKQDDPKGDLTYIGGGIYKETYTIEGLAEDYDIKYKIAFNHSWDSNIGNGSEDISLTIPAGTEKFTVFVDAINWTASDSIRTEGYEVQQSGGTPYTAGAYQMSVSLIGTVRGSETDDWEPSKEGYEFTQISQDLFVYNKVFNKAGSYQYKAVFDYSKWYEKESGDRSITTADGQNVVFLYNAKDGSLYDSVNNTDTVAELLGMKSADIISEAITNANKTTRFVLASDADKTADVKLVYQPVVKAGNSYSFEDNSVQTIKKMKAGTDGAGNFNNSFVSDDIFFGDDAVAVAYYYTVNGTEQVPVAEDKQIKIEGKSYALYERDAFTGRTVCVPGTFPGKSWDEASNKMTYEGNGLYSYTFKNVPAANYEFKISMGSWDENYGQDGIRDGSNYGLAVSRQQDITVYYSDLTHLAVTSLTYKFANITLSGTGVDNVKLEDKGLTGIYSAEVDLATGTYNDIKYVCDGSEFASEPFTLDDAKTVTFYFAPEFKVYYNNASDIPVNEEQIFFDTKDTRYKSTYGAVATGSNTTFSIDTGSDVTKAVMVVRGPENKEIEMTAKEATSGKTWSAGAKFDTIGQYTYFFVLSTASSVKVYCDDDGYYGKGHVVDLTDLKPYDLVVYKDGFKTPGWMKDAVIYQIFPDRFYNGDVSNDQAQTTARGAVDYEYIRDWYTIPENPEQETLHPDTYPSNAHKGDGEWSNEIYGGDLKGIIDRMDYLKALGVNVIYLNPVFSSISSHRYDTSDYMQIDPVLGTLGDFGELTSKAKEYGMHIVLDGVFNHVSDDSIYFDRYYKFLGKNGNKTVGAYPYWAYVYDYMADNTGASMEAARTAAKAYFTDKYGVTDFSYTEWFNVYKDEYLTDDNEEIVKDTIGERIGKPVYGYEGWWGYDSMPVVASTNGSEYQTGNWGQKVIGNTADNKDASDNITQYWLSKGSNGWRLDVANEVSDETWQNFRESVKALGDDNVIIGEIWDDATEYLLGDMYDSVMNYVFRNAVIDYVKGGKAEDMMKSLEKTRERYPEEAFYAMMNLVGSHDTTRLLSYLDGIDDDRNQKETDKAFPSYETTSARAKAKQYLVALIQMTYAGAPTIYYGDEMGQAGSDDPDDRRTTPWGKGNEELVTYYAKLAAIRSQYTALRTGSISYISTGDASVAGYKRSDKDSSLLILGNNAGEEKEVTIDVQDVTKLTDLVSGKEYNVNDGILTITIAPDSGVILTDTVKEISVNKAALAPAYDPSYICKEISSNNGNSGNSGIILGNGTTGTTPGTDSTPGTGTTPGTSAAPGTDTTPGTSAAPGTDTTPGASVAPGTSAVPQVTDAPGGEPSATPVPTVTPGVVTDTKVDEDTGTVTETTTKTEENKTTVTEKVTMPDGTQSIKETVKETNTEGIITITEKLNSTVVNATILTHRTEYTDGKFISADAAIYTGISDINSDYSAKVKIPASYLESVKAAGADTVGIYIEKPTVDAVKDNQGRKMVVKVSVPDVEGVSISNVTLTKDSITAALESTRKLVVKIESADPAGSYTVTIPQSELKQMDGDIDVSVKTKKVSGMDSTSKNKINNILSSNGIGADNAYVVAIPANNTKGGIKVTTPVLSSAEAGGNVYVYRYDSSKGTLVETANSKRTVLDDKSAGLEGYCGNDYVVTDKELSGKNVTTLIGQSKASLNKSSVKKGGSAKVKVSLPDSLVQKTDLGKSVPYGKEAAVVTYKTSNAKVAKISKDGKIQAKGKGKAAITVKIKLAGGKVKTIKKNITVK